MIGEDTVGSIAPRHSRGPTRQADGNVTFVFVPGMDGVGAFPRRRDGPAPHVNGDVAHAASLNEGISQLEVLSRPIQIALCCGYPSKTMLDQAEDAVGVKSLRCDRGGRQVDVNLADAPVPPPDTVRRLALRDDGPAGHVNGDRAPARRDHGLAPYPEGGNRSAGVRPVNALGIPPPRHDDAVGGANADVAQALMRSVDATGRLARHPAEIRDHPVNSQAYTGTVARAVIIQTTDQARPGGVP